MMKIHDCLNFFNQQNMDNIDESCNSSDSLDSSDSSETNSDYINSEHETSDNEELESDTDNNRRDNDVLFLLRVNDDIVCYCKDINDINEAVRYHIKNLNFKFIKEGYNVHTYDEKWKILDNRMVSYLYGNKPNWLIFYDNILSSIEIELVPKFKKLN